MGAGEGAGVMSRQAIFNEINTERQMQESQGFDAAHDYSHSCNDWVALVARHAGLGVNDGAKDFDPERFRKQMVRVAALAVASIEALDRFTGKEASAGSHVLGSGF